jgi:hypothetical protein
METVIEYGQNPVIEIENIYCLSPSEQIVLNLRIRKSKKEEAEVLISKFVSSLNGLTERK